MWLCTKKLYTGSMQKRRPRQRQRCIHCMHVEAHWDHLTVIPAHRMMFGNKITVTRTQDKWRLTNHRRCCTARYFWLMITQGDLHIPCITKELQIVHAQRVVCPKNWVTKLHPYKKWLTALILMRFIAFERKCPRIFCPKISAETVYQRWFYLQ